MPHSLSRSLSNQRAINALILDFPMPILISLVALSLILCASIMRSTYKLFLIDHPDGTRDDEVDCSSQQQQLSYVFIL